MMMSETATVRLPPGFQACLPWLARGVGPEAANCYTKRPRLRGPQKDGWYLAQCLGAGLRKVLGCKLPGLAALRPPCPC